MSLGSDHAPELITLSAAMHASVVSTRLSMAFPLWLFCLLTGHDNGHVPVLRSYSDTGGWNGGRTKCRIVERTFSADAPSRARNNAASRGHYEMLMCRGKLPRRQGYSLLYAA